MGSVLNARKLLIDTNILIDFLRARKESVDFFNQRERQLLVSAITVAELYSGVRGEDEQQQIQKLLNILHIVPVSASIAKRGGLLKKKFAKSHGLGIADAVIAATALEENAGLITLNLKHFPMIKAKEAPY